MSRALQWGTWLALYLSLSWSLISLTLTPPSVSLSSISGLCVLLCTHMAFVLVTEEAERLLIATVGSPLGQSISSFSSTKAPISLSVCFIQFLPLCSQDLRKATQLAHGVMMQYQGDITQRGGFHSYQRSMWEVPSCCSVRALCGVFRWPRMLHVCIFVNYNFWF